MLCTFQGQLTEVLSQEARKRERQVVRPALQGCHMGTWEPFIQAFRGFDQHLDAGSSGAAGMASNNFPSLVGRAHISTGRSRIPAVALEVLPGPQETLVSLHGDLGQGWAIFRLRETTGQGGREGGKTPGSLIGAAPGDSCAEASRLAALLPAPSPPLPEDFPVSHQ